MTPLLRKLLLIDLFKYHKLKMASAVLFFLLIFAWIFPFSDLSDFVTNFVSTQTRGQVFVQFNRLDFGFLPTVSIEGEDILLDVAQVHENSVRILCSATLRKGISCTSFLHLKLYHPP